MLHDEIIFDSCVSPNCLIPHWVLLPMLTQQMCPQSFLSDLFQIRTGLGSTFFKVVGIYPAYHVTAHLCNANSVINHELSKLFAID